MTYTEKELKELPGISNININELSKDKVYLFKVTLDDKGMSKSSKYDLLHNFSNLLREYGVNFIIIPTGEDLPEFDIFELEPNKE